MSFSKKVKDELVMHVGSARHCRLAELSAILAFGGQLSESGSHLILKLHTENEAVARKYFTLIKKPLILILKFRLSKIKMAITKIII